MNILLICNLSDKTVNGGTWTPPIAVFDEAWTIALRLTETVGGNEITSPMNVTGMAAAIGLTDTPPSGGKTKLQIGDGVQTSGNTTDAFNYNVDAGTLQGLINAKTAVTDIYGAATVRQVNGSFLIKFANGTQAALTLRENELYPLSFGRVTATQFDGVWIHELRLMQLPVDFTDSSERVLTPAPTVTEVVHGGTVDGFKTNEVQALYVRPDFAANYTLKMAAGGQTTMLSVQDNQASIQAALEAVYGAGNFKVTNTAPWTANIEFIGEFAGTAVDLLTVTALNAPLGDLTFTLPLNKPALLSRLRAEKSVQLPLEVRLYYLDRNSAPQKAVVILQQLTIVRPLIMPELADVPDANWLTRIPAPKDYTPFSPDSVIVGHAFFRAVVGNASSTAFVVAHGLDTDDVFVWVRQNTSTGVQLIPGTDYSVHLDDANSVTVTALLITPALNAWVVEVLTSQDVAAFADGLMLEIGQVTGLETRLEAIETAIAALQALVATTPLGSTSGSSTSLTINVPKKTMIYPGDGDATTPPSPAGYLLPAIHDSADSFTTLPLPSNSTAKGNVYQNNTAAALAIPGGGLVRQSSVPVGGYFGGDGRVRYPLTRALGPVRSYTCTGHNGAGNIAVTGLLAGDRIVSVTDTTASADVTAGFTSPVATNDTLVQTSSADLHTHSLTVLVQGARTSFFPTPFEIELFNFEVNAQMLRAGSTLSVSFTLLLQLLNATSRAQYIFVLEHGIAPSQTDPAITSPNLQDVIWNPTPMITQRIVLSAAQVQNQFGVDIIRAAGGTLSANKKVYGFVNAADSIPVSADLALRARLINFDTENSIPTARGTISLDTGTITAAIQY